VLRCRECRSASIVLDGVTQCPRCGYDHVPSAASVTPLLPAWLTEPVPLSIWLGGVKYLGGHIERDAVTTGGLLLDRRGVHLRAFAEVFTIPWQSVHRVEIEGPSDISERLTMSRMVALGASTWVTSIAYLTVCTDDGDAIFEIDGLGPPELRARLSRVLTALERAEPSVAPIPLERAEPAPFTIDPETTDAPLEVLVVDALWKLAQVHDAGLLDADDFATLRTRLLACLDGAPLPAAVRPLLRV
jgi:hypothetical protein